MSVYKQKGSAVWWMKFMYEGQVIRKSTKCRNKRDAEEVERAYRTQLAKNEVGIEEKKPVPMFKEAIREFLDRSQIDHAGKRNTMRRTETSSKALLRFFDGKRLDAITVEEVEKFKDWRRRQKKQPPHRKLQKQKRATTTKPIKPATVNRELACLRAMINHFIRNDVLVKNPVSRVKFLKEDNELMRVVTDDEERLYLLAASQPLRDVAVIMIETGMRPEEVCRLERRHVHLNEGYIFNPFGKTKAARRKLPLSRRAAEVLRYRLASTQGAFVFPSTRGGDEPSKPIVKLNAAHNGAVTRAKLEPFRLYDLRHTFATRAAEAGVDLVTLAALLGHSRVQMVMRYAHPSEKHQFEAIRAMEASREAKSQRQQQAS
ncbi:MAG TPA: tyrosine-type recombinase/integrase [Pyrinomonadaceae bacterium]|nr:tyrosine-type recombinase/integrase [Pyrinomonadaceae bacterium]